MIEIELFTANQCKRCLRANRVLIEIADALGNDQVRLKLSDVVKNLDAAVAAGVLTTPALLVDGRLVFSPLPGRDTIYHYLKGEL